MGRCIIGSSVIEDVRADEGYRAAPVSDSEEEGTFGC